MDLWMEIYQDNAEKLVAVLKEFGFDMPQFSKDIFLREDQIVRLGIPPMRIELLTTTSGVSFEECHLGRMMSKCKLST